MGRTRRNCRPGSTYFAVLGAAMLVTVLGLSALMATRVQTRSDLWSHDVAKSRLYALSAVHLAFMYISRDPNWRANWPNGTWIAGQKMNDGSFDLKVVDPDDGDLADSESDPIQITGIGHCGNARHKTQVTLVPDIRTLAALNTCLHAGGNIIIKEGRAITLTGAALSTNADLSNRGVVDGDVDAGSISQLGAITGTVTCPAEAKRLPDADLFDAYKALATEISNPGTIDGIVLGPGRNPWGSANADGVYYIDTGGGDLTIKNSRIYGTLLVKCGGGTVKITGKALLHNYRDEYPTLIVDGDLEISLDSATKQLDESSVGNMNPLGAPYQGQADSDVLDIYPNELQGLVHVRGNLTLSQTSCVRGVVICEGQATCDGTIQVVHMPTLYESPPSGYTYVARMKISPGTWKQVVP